MSSETNKNKRKSPEKSSADPPKPPEEKRPRSVCKTFWFRVKDTDVLYPLLEARIPADSLLWAVSHTEVPLVDDATAAGVAKGELVLGLPDDARKSKLIPIICRKIFEVLDGRGTLKDFPFSTPSVCKARSICRFWLLLDFLEKIPDPFPIGLRYYKSGASIAIKDIGYKVEGVVFVETGIALVISDKQDGTGPETIRTTYELENILGYEDRVVLNIPFHGITLKLIGYRNGYVSLLQNKCTVYEDWDDASISASKKSGRVINSS